MKRSLIFIVLLLSSVFLQAQNSIYGDRKVIGNHHDAPAQNLYNWTEIEALFSKHLAITSAQSKDFFRYATKWKYLKMQEYRQLIKEGAVTKANAQQYWLNKLPYLEEVYKYKYLSAMETEKAEAIKRRQQLADRNSSANQTASASCNNLDFSAGTTANWTGKWNNQGSSYDTTIGNQQEGYGYLSVTGLNSSGFNSMGYVHELCNGGTDPLVPVNTVPPGHTYSLRLGDDAAGQSNNNPYNHQTISNTFSVTASSQTITYWYAVVLSQNTTTPHTPSEQPYFKIRMYDSSGIEITCAQYDVNVSHAEEIGGFDSTDIVAGGNTDLVLYKNWTQILIPLVDYTGQNVTITFETSDCALGGHFGYAYIAVDCAPLQVIVAPPQPCIGGNTFLTAPTGVASYTWTGSGIVGSNTAQTATVSTGGTYTVNMTTFANTGDVGCILTLTTTVLDTSTIAPVASFTATTPCLNASTQFTDESTLLSNQGTFDAWNWTFGDGGTSTSHNPTHLYTAAGTYPVSYTITSSVNCAATYTSMVTVNPLPTPSFTAAPVCTGAATNFINTSTGAATYTWNFGSGGATSALQQPSYTYPNAGVFTVNLTGANTFSCMATATNTILVNIFPTVSFSAPPACLGSSTVFNNTSIPTTNVVYSWDFGDGTITDTSNTQNPSFVYPATGTFVVTLTVTPTDGCVSTKTNTVVINPIPYVSVTSPPPVVCWNEVVPAPTLSNSPNNPTITYTWGNTNTAIGLSSGGTGVPPNFIAGINNTSSNIDGIITITPSFNGCVGPPANYTVTVVPTPIVIHANLNYCPGEVVPSITLTASPAEATPNVTWSATTLPPIGMLATSGDTIIPGFTTISPVTTPQSIMITLNDNLAGCNGPTSTFYITVNANPVAKFNYSSACTGNPTHFTDESTTNSGIIDQWNWNFGDANSVMQDPSYQFTSVQNYTVNLRVTTNFGCTNDTTEVVHINPSAVISFTADTISCSPLITNFMGTASMPIKTYNWNFGNTDTISYTGQTVATQTYTNGSHTQVKYFTVSFGVVTDSGCVTNLIKQNYITVYPNPLAGFAFNPTNANVLDPLISFQDQSVGASGINAYNWSFGDVYETVDSLNYANIANPTHLYSPMPYAYEVTQIVENIYGCKDSITETVTILPAVTFYIPNAFSPNGDGTNDYFKGEGIGIDDATYNMWIFDRWGLMIFHATDLETAWDGTLHGEKVQEDVYVWKVSFKDVFKKEHDYHGTVTIIK